MCFIINMFIRCFPCPRVLPHASHYLHVSLLPHILNILNTFPRSPVPPFSRSPVFPFPHIHRSMLASFERKLGIQQDRSGVQGQATSPIRGGGGGGGGAGGGLTATMSDRGAVTVQLGSQLKVDLNFRL